MENRTDLVTALLIDAALTAVVTNPERAARVLSALDVPAEVAKRVLTQPERRRPVPDLRQGTLAKVE